MANATQKMSHIGLRNFKTACSAALCAWLYYLIDRNPTFVCIGAVYGMGNSVAHSWKQGGNRIMGTIIGGTLGVVLFWLYLRIEPHGEIRASLIPLTFLGVMVLISVSLVFRWPDAIQPGCVVLCIILFNTPVESYVSYSANRMIDTIVGVVISMMINYFLPRERIKRWDRKLKDLIGHT